MHRIAVVNNLRREYNESERVNTTPIRENIFTVPRRLLALDFDSARNSFGDNSSLNDVLAKTAISTGVPPLRRALAIPPAAHSGDHRALQWALGQAHQQPSVPQPTSVGDRFIPCRRDFNVDASHYYHTHGSESEKDGSYINVFEEIKNATEHWRRKYMEKGFQQINIFNGLQSKRVLNIGESSTLDINRMKIQEFKKDGEWDCRTRKLPLMNMKGEISKRYRDHGAQIFRFAMPIRFKHLIDWSSQNLLAAGLADTMCICEVDFKKLSKVCRVDHNSYLCNVKWNHEGTMVAMSSLDGSTSLYSTNLSKILWTRMCPCNEIEHRKKCKVLALEWSKKYSVILTACNEGFLSVIDQTNGELLSEKVFEKEILAISLSPQEHYLVMSGADMLVKIFYFPTLIQTFEIAFFACVKAFAWHPWSTGILCIGGGPGDASISLWNVNSERQLGYRKVKFVGSVDTMMFNKLSGELVVHWYYLEDNRLRSKIAVLASLDKIVDAVPIQPEHRMLNIVWSPDHTKLAMQHRDTLVIWNFFGDESDKWSENKKKLVDNDPANKLRNYFDTQSSTGPYTSLANARRGKSFAHYNIR